MLLCFFRRKINRYTGDKRRDVLKSSVAAYTRQNTARLKFDGRKLPILSKEVLTLGIFALFQRTLIFEIAPLYCSTGVNSCLCITYV